MLLPYMPGWATTVKYLVDVSPLASLLSSTLAPAGKAMSG